MERMCINIATKPVTLVAHLNNNCYTTGFPRSATAASVRLFNPLRSVWTQVKSNDGMAVKKKGKTERGFSAVCYASPIPIPIPTPILSHGNYHWISTISSLVLMLSRGTAVKKSFLVPLLLLHSPPSVISWMKCEFGVWVAFLTLLVRLFLFIPGELELPFMASLLVIVAPYQVMKLRGTQEGAIIALLIAGYLAFQHFSWAGDLQRAFDGGSLVATLATISLTVTSLLLLI